MSFNNTISSSSGVANQVMPLRYILRNSPITTFEISMTNADGTRRTDTQMEAEAAEQPKATKKQSIVKGGKTNAQKIQSLLDQRKPPTEKLPSLCSQYDDDLNSILDSDI
jgi:hypothetical protein